MEPDEQHESPFSEYQEEEEMRKMKLYGSRLLVKLDEAKEKTASGLIIPDQGKEKPFEGEVIAIGQLETDVVKVGDKIVFSRYGGLDCEIDGVEYRLIDVNDIVIIYEESK